MTYRVVVDPKARDDLLQIHAYIADDSPLAAGRWIDRLEAEMHSLAEMPGRYPARDDLRTGYRMLVVGSYLIFYRIVGDEEVQIARVVHGARDLPALFADDGN